MTNDKDKLQNQYPVETRCDCCGFRIGHIPFDYDPPPIVCLMCRPVDFFRDAERWREEHEKKAAEQSEAKAEEANGFNNDSHRQASE